MKIVVDGTPESCLEHLSMYLMNDWPYGGKFSVGRHFSGEDVAVVESEKRYLFNSWWGLATILVLSLVTLGTFLFLYVLYVLALMFLEEFELIRLHHMARVFAIPVGHARTELQVDASRQDWQQTLESWIQQELVDGQAAAIDPEEIEAYQETTSSVQGTLPDIPDQIKKLAELRNSGTITEEEFERKKAELLDRM